MKQFLERLLKNWPRKLVALISALFIWLLVNQTITTTRVISDVPVRVINLPPDKTVVGLLPNGLLTKRIAVTIVGKKSVVDDLRSSDVEMIINADGHKESWIATLDKRNLVSINPEIELKKNVTEVKANELFIKMSRLITDEIPITITKPIGDPPKGYQFLDVWPKHLNQKVSGPEEQVRALKDKGLELTFNLNKITQAELDTLYNQQGQKDEITFKIPDAWKRIAIPFKDNALEPLNDVRSKLLRIDFLKQELIPLNIELPITIFFPVKYSQTINPETYSLATNHIVQKKNGLKRLTLPLYVRDVSRLFLDVVKDNLLLVIVAVPKNVQEDLNWSIEFVDEKVLEDEFVKESLAHADETFTKYTEQTIRYRFRDYLRNFNLYTENGSPFRLKAQLNASTITLDQE